MPKFISWNEETPGHRPPLVTIDLGYSERRPSCGVWYDGSPVKNNRQFYRAIELITTQLNATLTSGVRPLLVVEAPLSRAHTLRRNPTLRGSFEQGRRCYSQSGASVSLAATDSLWCALISASFELDRARLVSPPDSITLDEGWIWIPSDCKAEGAEAEGLE